MGGWSEDLLAGLATSPWQPQSLRPPVRDRMSLRLRLGLLAAVAALHLIATLALLRLFEGSGPAPADDAILVDFIQAAPVAAPLPLPNETITIHPPPARPVLPRPPPSAATPTSEAAPPTRPRPRAEVPMQAVDSPPRPLQLYKSDGSLRLPEDMLDKLDQKFGDKRVFSYQIPHMDDAKKYFERNPALVYEGTRFDQYWTPDADALTALLTKMVEATTKEVKVRVPGSASSYMVCKVSILALGGGCGIVTDGADWNGPQDDPNTLSPEEDRQCAAWWEQIVGAKTQEAWRATRKLYERECRKPRERRRTG